jgi:outer membrane protein assembly factor BamA
MIIMKSATIKYFCRIVFFIQIPLLFFTSTILCQKKYTVNYSLSGKDTSYKLQQLGLTSSFDGKEFAIVYVSALPKTLLDKGFPGASVDSTSFDSASANVKLYLGEQYKWVQINTDSIDNKLLDATGWNAKQFKNRRIDFPRLQQQEERILNYYENSGYPFAEVSLENIVISGDNIQGDLTVKKGPFYHIDSIRILGKEKIKNLFLQHYLGISNGSIYNSQKLKEVTKRLQQLTYLQEVQPSDVTMLGSGSVLNLYLQPKRSSEINVLVGFLPGNTTTNKTQVTGDVHLNLKNALGSGENILVNWQQLQPQSPRLNLGYTHPYIFNSLFGIDFAFDLLKKDSSYLQLNAVIGIQYILSANQSGKIFYQNERSFLLSGGVDTNRVLLTRTLPPNIDVSSGNFGINYNFINTNYRINPRKGNEVDFTASAGIKKITKNNDIIHLKDPAEPAFDFNTLYDSVKLRSYRLRVTATGAHYSPIGKSSTLKIALSAGWFQSPQIFQNELFQIGGYRLLRGFDEESIYADKYAVFTAEYRYLVGINSYFFGFSDFGLTHTSFGSANYSDNFISGGVGLAFETKFGLLNLSYAIGKRDDIKFDIRKSSKIHFGYINYF